MKFVCTKEYKSQLKHNFVTKSSMYGIYMKWTVAFDMLVPTLTST